MLSSPWRRWLKSLGPVGGRARNARWRSGRPQVERLEDRLAPTASPTFVNDNWNLVTDNGTVGVVDSGDILNNANDTINAGGVVVTYGVNGFGTVTTGTATGSNPNFDTINDAITNTAVGGTVNVLEGTYNELVQVNKTLSLHGAQFGVDARTGRPGAAESIVDNGDGDFQILANNVTIDGFTIQGADNNPSDPPFTALGAGIWSNPGFSGTNGGHLILNNIIQNNISGIELANDGTFQTVVQFNLIRNNNFPGAGSGSGIRTDFGLTNALIDSNYFTGNPDSSVNFQAAGDNVTISNNESVGDGRLAFLVNVTNSSITDNTVTGSTFAASADIRIFGGVSNLNIERNVLQGGSGDAIRINDGLGGSPNSGINLHFNSITGYAGDGLEIVTGGYTGTLDASCNWWGDVTGPTTANNPGGAGDSIVDPGSQVDFQPWLVYAPDADSATSGVQFVTSFTVNAQTTGFTTTNNNYRRLVNALDCIQDGQTVILSGNFDWTETNAAASWALGNDGINGTDDDFSLVITPNISNVTVTAASLGMAQITGPGDIPTANLEGVFVFDGGDNQGWTISNLEILDFDLSIGMFNGAGGSDAYNGTTITNNRIRVAADVTADVNQNIGIHYSFGTNQTISDNQIELVDTGATGTSMVGMQSNTSGGAVYDGLQITGNVVTITGALVASPPSVLGIWENGHAHTSDITVSNNQVLNLTTGGTSATNVIRAFRVTSHSSAATTVAYTGNIVDGANIGFQWLASQNFAGNQPVQLTGNTITNSDTGVLVQSNGSASLFGNTITGSGVAGVNILSGTLAAAARNFISGGTGDGILLSVVGGANGPIFNNDLGGNTGFGVNNLTGVLVDAFCNWWGTNAAAGVAGEVNGLVDYTPWLDVGTDTSATAGFQGDFSTLHVDDTSPQVGALGRIAEGIMATGAAATPTVIIEAGTYLESVAANKANLTLRGATGTATDVVIDPASGNGISVSANNVTIEDLRVTGAGGGFAAGIFAQNITDITLDNVQADANANGFIQFTSAGTTTIRNSSFNNNNGSGFPNTGFGLGSLTTPTVIYVLENVTANGNAASGVNFNTAASVTVTGTNSFSTNGSSGLDLRNTLGAVSLTGVTANGNTGFQGLFLVGATSVSVTNSSFTNNNLNGFFIDIGSTVTLSDLTVTGNGSNSSIDATPTVNFTGTTGNVADVITATGSSLQHTRDPLGTPVINNNIDLSGIVNLNLFGDNGADTFNVTPPSTGGTHIAVNGGAPTMAPGDVLNFDAQGASVTDDGDTLTSTGFEPVDYTNIETTNLVNAVGGLVVNGTNNPDMLRLFVDPVLGPAYQLNGGPVTAVGGASSFTFNGMDEADTMIVDLSGGDPIPAGNVFFNGGNPTMGPGDGLAVIGDGTDTGFYNPSATTPGSGNVQIVGKGAIIFTGLEPTTVSAMASFTFVTPNSTDVLTIDSPAAGRNRISGTSDGVGFEALTFFDITTFILDTGANDGALPDDQVTLDASGLVATGLQNFIVAAGAGNDSFTVNTTNYSTPTAGGGVEFQGGLGTDTFFGNADIDYTLADSGVTSSAGGTVAFGSVEQADLTGGASNNTFTVSGWTQTASLHGAGGVGDQVISVADEDYILSDTTLIRNAATFLLDSIESADLTGGGSANTFTVSGWTQTASIDGQGGSDTVRSANDSDFTLSDTSLTRSNGATGTFTLTSVELADLSGGAAANTFTIANWSGTATLDGQGAGDTYNVTFQGFGTGTVAIADTGATSGDAASVTGTSADDAFSVTPMAVTLGGESVTYTANLEQATVNGDVGSDSFDVTPSASTTFTINGGDPTPPASPGDALNVNLAGTTSPVLTGTSTPTGFTGSYTFGNRKPVNFTTIETLTPSIIISGQKFEDFDGDGVKDPVDRGIAGVTIFLDGSNGGTINGALDAGEFSAVTNAGGNYSFVVVPGTYRVREVVPPGFVQTTADPADVSLSSGVFPGVDFGNFQLYTISGRKFEDLNFDGSDGRTVLLSEAFTGGLGTFTASGATGLWHATTAVGGNLPGHTSPDFAYYGIDAQANYDSGAANSGDLTSGSLAIPATGSAFLRFKYRLQSEAGTPFDAAQIQVSTDGGATFPTVIASNGGGQIPQTLTWRSLTFDLSAFAGQTIQIRFHFDTVDAISNALLGWQVDDVQVVGGITDPGLSGVTVFVDVNGNNMFDGGDLSATTTATGDYTIPGVGPGTFQVLEVLPVGFVQTTPNPAPIAGSSGSNVEGVDFGNFEVEVSIVANDGSASETTAPAVANPGQFTVTRTGPTAAALTVFYTLAGTATNGTDYTTLTGSVVLGAGQSSAVIDVNVINDPTTELPESVVVSLTANAAYTLAAPTSAFVVIADNEPEVSITANDANGAEAILPNPGQFTVTRTGDTSAALTVNYTIGGTATNGTDYTMLPISVMIPAGQSSAVIDVTVTNDMLTEVSETVVLTLAAGTYTIANPTSATVTIADNDNRLFAAGTASNSSQIRAFNAVTGAERFNFLAYPGFGGGINVTIGDVTGDGIDDIITGAAAGGGPHVKVFDGQTGAEIRSFFAFGIGFTGGVNVASGDVNNDGFDDIIVGAGPGAGPHVKVFNGQTGAEIASFFAYAPDFAGGVRVVAGKVNADGFSDVITAPGPNGSGQVNIIDGTRLNQVQANGQISSTAFVRTFAPYPGFAGGIFVASGDVNGDGFSDVITGAGASPHVKVFSGQTGAEIASFFAYDQAFSGGVIVAATDRDGDGLANIVTGAGPGAGPHVKIFNGLTLALLDSFFAFSVNNTGGVAVGGHGL